MLVLEGVSFFLRNMLFSPFYADIDVFEEVFENNVGKGFFI